MQIVKSARCSLRLPAATGRNEFFGSKKARKIHGNFDPVEPLARVCPRGRPTTKKFFWYMEVVVVVVGGRILWKSGKNRWHSWILRVENCVDNLWITCGKVPSYPHFVHIAMWITSFKARRENACSTPFLRVKNERFSSGITAPLFDENRQKDERERLLFAFWADFRKNRPKTGKPLAKPARIVYTVINRPRRWIS